MKNEFQRHHCRSRLKAPSHAEGSRLKAEGKSLHGPSLEPPASSLQPRAFFPRASSLQPRAIRGFTLIEIMLGASIIAIITVALMGGYLGQSYLNENARNLMAAMNDATRVMEEIRNQNTAANCASHVPADRPSVRPPPLTGGLLCPPPGGAQCESWNDWLDAQLAGQGKSIRRPTSNVYEIVVVTCQEVGDQDGDGLANEYCGWRLVVGVMRGQVGRQEWYPWYQAGAATSAGSPAPGQIAGSQWGVLTNFDPIRVTVAVGWAQKRAGVGDLAFGGSGSEFTYKVTSGGKGTVTTSDQLTIGPDSGPNGVPNGVIDSPAMLTTLITCR